MATERQQDDHASRQGAQARFRCRRDIRISECIDSQTNRKEYFLKITMTGDLFQFGEKEHFILSSLDGARSFEEIEADFRARFGFGFSREQFHVFLNDLCSMELIEPVEPQNDEGPRLEPQSVEHMDEEDRAQARNRKFDPFRFRLFNPTRLLRALAWLFRPARYFVWTLIPAILMAGLILFHRQTEFLLDIKTLVTSLSIVPAFLIGLFTVNLLSRLAQGAVAISFGAKFEQFGVTLFLGFLPRFYIDTISMRRLERRGQLWSYAAPLLTRLALFAAGTFVWIAYRQTGTLLPDIALAIGQMGFWAFVITSVPLLPTDGYQWFARYFEVPHLRERALRLLGIRLKGRPVPEAMTGSEKWVLTLFAIGMVIFTGVLFTGLMLYFGVKLEERFQGTGVSLFFGIFSLSLLWLFALRQSAKRLRATGPKGRGALARPAPVALAARGAGEVVPAYPDLPARRATTDLTEPRAYIFDRPQEQRPSRRARYVWLTIALVLGVVAFLPYPYESGGDFTILPTARVEVRARVSGELLEIYVDEGDWVEEGQILAVLSDWDEVRDLAVTKADLDKSRAELQRLEVGPKPEKVQLAQKQVESAKARLTFSKAEAERQATLLAAGHASRRTAEKAQSEYDEDLADLAVARANLELVKSGATKSEIEAARAEVRRLVKEHEYRVDELERTQMRAPAEGRVVTPNPQLLRGQYLHVGGLFVELEDNRVARAEVEIPETDIGEVQEGDLVRLKAWGLSEKILTGRVESIAPVAEKRAYGLIVRVKTEIPNPDGTLKSDMTGYAKIEGSEMPAWEAYSRLIFRFFQIELWSWIP